MKRAFLMAVVGIAGSAGLTIQAQQSNAVVPTSSPSAPTPNESGAWLLDLTLLNAVEGNINHDTSRIRSYGVVPGVSIRHESSSDAGFAFGYDGALNNYTGTDEWDRISHGLYAIAATHGRRWRAESTTSATWKGSSDDRELDNEYTSAARFAYRLSDNLRFVGMGGLRYKQYSDDPGTTGFAPFVGGKVDRRLAGDRRVAFAYKRELRDSREVKQRYERNVWGVDVSSPFAMRGGRLSAGFDWKQQTYDRLIKVAGERVKRHDDRFVLGVEYLLPVRSNVSVSWRGGYESRGSNDPNKRFVAPAFGMNLVYHRR